MDQKKRDNNEDLLFLDCHENYCVEVWFNDLIDFITKNNLNYRLSSRYKAICRGILCGFSIKEIAKELYLSASGLKVEVSENLSSLIKAFFEIDRIQWSELGSLLEKNRYKKNPLEIELSKISKKASVKALAIINSIESKQSQSSAQKLTEAERLEIMNEGDSDWKNGNYFDAFEKYEIAINGNLNTSPSPGCIMKIIAGFKDLKDYEQLYLMAKYSKPYIKEDKALSSLYLYIASCYDDLCLANSNYFYLIDARSNYQESLNHDQANMWSAWNMVRVSIEYNQKCQVKSHDSLNCLTTAKNDFNSFFKPALQLANSLPKAIIDDLEKILKTLGDEEFKADIRNTISKFR